MIKTILYNDLKYKSVLVKFYKIKFHIEKIDYILSYIEIKL